MRIRSSASVEQGESKESNLDVLDRCLIGKTERAEGNAAADDEPNGFGRTKRRASARKH